MNTLLTNLASQAQKAGLVAEIEEPYLKLHGNYSTILSFLSELDKQWDYHAEQVGQVFKLYSFNAKVS